MRRTDFVAVLLVILLLSLPTPAKAHGTHNCSWTDPTKVIVCLHETKHLINSIWDKVEATWEGVVQGGKDTLFGTVKEIDSFLKEMETSFNVAQNQFNSITGTTMDSIELGMSVVQPIIEDEFLGAKAFLGTDPNGCGPDSECAVYRNELKDFLLSLNGLSSELANFYDSIPPDSPLGQVDMLYNLIDYLPGYFLYPMARAMQEMDMSFPYYSAIVNDLTDDILVLKQAVIDTPFSPAVAASYDKYGNSQMAALDTPESLLTEPCGFILANREAVVIAKSSAYGLAILVKGVGLILKIKGQTVQTDQEVAAWGWVGTRIRIDKPGAAGIVISGVADAALAVLGAATTKLHYCDLLGGQGELDGTMGDLSTQLTGLSETLNGLGDLGNLSTQLTTLNSEISQLNGQLVTLQNQHGDLTSDHTAMGSQLTGLQDQHTALGNQISGQGTQLSNQLTNLSAQLDYIQRCMLVKGKAPADC